MSMAAKYAAALTTVIVAFFAWLLGNFGLDGLLFLLIAVTVSIIIAGVFAVVRMILEEVFEDD